jgi:N-acetylmuramoyl-L-alanine amidase
MKIAISSAHAKYVGGARDLIDEVTESRKVVAAVVPYLRAAGVEVAVFNDDTSRTQAANLSAIVAFHNAQWRDRDYDVSVHFNASPGGTTQSALGTEVLHLTQPAMAAKVSAAIAAASGLKDRGAKKRTNLSFLSKTNRPALLIEVLFVNSSPDVAIYRRVGVFDAICKAIVSALTGGSKPPPPAPAMPVLRKGSVGNAVRELQRLLGGLVVDGIFGSLTEARVRMFQMEHNIGVDGVVGPVTWSKLKS